MSASRPEGGQRRDLVNPVEGGGGGGGIVLAVALTLYRLTALCLGNVISLGAESRLSTSSLPTPAESIGSDQRKAVAQTSGKQWLRPAESSGSDQRKAVGQTSGKQWVRPAESSGSDQRKAVAQTSGQCGDQR